MKYLKIILALLLTAAMLYVARNTSRGRPEQLSHMENGITFDYNTVPKATEFGKAHIEINVSGDIPEGSRVSFRQAKYGTLHLDREENYTLMLLRPSDSVADRYYIDITTGPKGRRVNYYFEVVDADYRSLAVFKMAGDQPFFTKFLGEVPKLVLIGHVFLMFATVFFLALAAMSAVALIRGGDNARPMAVQIFLATLAAFLGGYPYGFAMNHYAFGVIWEGVPFGTDATDNKTQLLFVYMLLVCLSSLKSLSGGKWGRDLFSRRTLGWLGLGALALQLLIYLIPHSIQFSKELTYGVCYGFIGLVAAVYITALLRGGRRTLDG